MSAPDRIVRVESATIRIPLERPTSFARRSVHHRDYGLVRIETADGLRGIGFCYGGSDGGALVRCAARELFAPLLLGQEATRTAGLWEEMHQEALLQGRAGSVLRALSALDIALWDRNARAAKLPLHRYLGGCATEQVPAYASGGYYLEGKTHKDLGNEVAGYLAAGFRAAKIKVGRASPAMDAQRMAAVRDAVGPDIHIMLDANNAWRNLPDALRHMAALSPFDPYWIEEPFGPDDLENHARLAAAQSVPVATGEILTGRWDFARLASMGGAAILQPDAAVCGGVTEYRRIAAFAEVYGLPVAPHWFHDLHAHLVAASPQGRFVEVFVDDQVLNFRRLIDRQMTIDPLTGGLRLSQDPGLGFDFDEDAVNRYAMEGWG